MQGQELDFINMDVKDLQYFKLCVGMAKVMILVVLVLLASIQQREIIQEHGDCATVNHPKLETVGAVDHLSEQNGCALL